MSQKEFGTLVNEPKEFGTLVSATKEFGTLVEETEDPSLGQYGAGLSAELALGEGLKYAGAVFGGPIGYGIGGIAGGISGSIAAQKLEGRDNISWGRVTSDTLLNLLPGGLGKAKKGSKVVKLAKGAGLRATEGAAIAVGGAQIEKGIEEGKLLTEEEFSEAMKQGAILNVGFAAVGESLKKVYPKFAGKGSSVLNNAYEKGDPDATQVVESIAGENPEGRGTRLKNMIFEYVYPSKITGKKVQLEIDRARDEAGAARELALDIKNLINNATKGASESETKALDDYLFNKTKVIPEKFVGIADDLNYARSKIEEYQNTILTLHKNGDIDLDPRIAQKIEESIDSKNYFTRDYKMYEDPSYKPTQQSIEKLKISLMKDTVAEGQRVTGMTEEQANEYIQKILDNRNNPLGLMNAVYSNKGVLRRRKDLSDEMREFLGEYKGAGERTMSTISRLGQLAAQEAGNARVVKSLTDTGVAQKFDPLQVPEGYEKLFIRNKQYDVYVPSNVNSSLNRLYGTVGKDAGSNAAEWLIFRLLKTGTAAAKFAAVPLNVAAYPVQQIGNAFLVMGQGMSPFRGYGKGLKVAINEFLPSKYKNRLLTAKEITELKELNLVNKGVTASDIREGFKEGIKNDKLNKLSKTGGVIGKLYNVFDTAQRVSVYENYKHFLRKIIPESQIKDMGRDFDRLAADLTNDTYMNYDRIAKPLRSLSKYGILNEFGAFNFELTRTTWNQAKLAKSMIDGSFAENLQKNFGVEITPQAAKEIRDNGIFRVGTLSLMLGASSQIPSIYNKQGGIDEEQENALRRTGLYDWEEDQALFMSRKGDEIKVANISYQMPTAELTSIVDSALRGENLIDSANKALGSLWEKFGSNGTIAAKNFFKAINGYDEFGNKIATDSSDLGSFFQLAGYFVGETYTPGTIKDFKNIPKRDTLDNVLRYTVGYRVRNGSINQSAGYKLGSLNDNISGIESKYAYSVKNENNVSDIYKSANQSFKRELNQTLVHIKDLRTLGKTDKQIEDLLSKKLRTLTKAEKQSLLNGVVPDLRISPSMPRGKDNRSERIQTYIDIANKMPKSMVMEMLKQDYVNKRIKANEVNAILGALKMQDVFKN